MALPAPRTHWRLSEIAEELESLDMSLDMDLTKDMDMFLRGSSVETDRTDTSSVHSGTSDTVELRSKSSDRSEKRKSNGKSRKMAPNVPPPPPPTQAPPTPPANQQPPKALTSPPCQPPPKPMTPPPIKPSTPPPMKPSTPPPGIPMSPPPLPPPETPPAEVTSRSSRDSRTINGVSVLPPLPFQQRTPKTSQSEEDDLPPPPPPMFDLPEPNFAPPSPCTSPLVLSNEQPLFRLSARMTSPSPLTLSDTSGYSTSCASSTVTSSGPERTSTVYAPTSVASTSSDQPSDMSDEMDQVFEKITDEDIHQVEMFYRSHKSQVYVCPGLVNLYFGPATRDGTGTKWELANTGIPVLLMDTGDARRQRKIQIILAEKGSGFILWKDNIDQLSNFKSVHSNFQSMYLSNDHTKLAGLSYDDENAANDFLTNLHDFTSDPNDEALKMGKNRKKKLKLKKQKYKPPKKTDISQPCGFVHVTKLDRNDHEQFVGSVQPLTARNPNTNNLSH